jgi:hypothetical protein
MRRATARVAAAPGSCSSPNGGGGGGLPTPPEAPLPSHPNAPVCRVEGGGLELELLLGSRV